MYPGRPHRLEREKYRGERTVAFTAVAWDRTNLFLTPEIVNPQIEFLRRSMEASSCFIPIYCFMPDHLHVVLRGTSELSDTLSAMEKFKHFSNSWMKRQGLIGWQPSFYDDIARMGDWKAKIRYVAQNPVRAGLVENCLDYPFLGSIGTDLTEITMPLE